MDDRDWKRLVDQLKNGDCTPVVGPGMTGPELPSEPAPGNTGFPDVAWPLGHPALEQLAMDRGAAFVRQRVVHDVAAATPPDFDDPSKPHALFAGLPLPVFLTTNYDFLMEEALRRAGKEPRGAVCPWYRGASRREPPARPSAFPTSAGPLVFHLHGSVADPRSLVLTEEDHFEFLISLATDLVSDDRTVVPAEVLPALTTRPLLFLGYRLDEWNFRFLIHGLLRTVAAVAPHRHVSIQLAPAGGATHGVRQKAEKYLAASFDRWHISVFWGTTGEFCADLSRRLGGG
jgi:SIR2-like domain